MSPPIGPSQAPVPDRHQWRLGFRGDYVLGTGDHGLSGPAAAADVSLRVASGNRLSLDLFGGIGLAHLTKEGEINSFGGRAGLRGGWYTGGGLSLFAEPSVGLGTGPVFDFSTLFGLNWDSGGDLPLGVFLGVGPRHMVASFDDRSDVGFWGVGVAAGISCRFGRPPAPAFTPEQLEALTVAIAEVVREYPIEGPNGPYHVTFIGLPKGHLTDLELGDLLYVIGFLNSLSPVLMTSFNWLKGSKETFHDGASFFSLRSAPEEVKKLLGSAGENYSSISLPTESCSDAVTLHTWRLSSLVHEMGHGLFEFGFKDRKDWEGVYEMSLGHHNYEIIAEHNYLEGCFMAGHPHEAPTESFASAVTAYFIFADHFVANINDPRIAEPIRDFGKLVWTFMRDKVFQGRVFTKDKTDPFKDVTFDQLMAPWGSKRVEFLGQALGDPIFEPRLVRWLLESGPDGIDQVMKAMDSHKIANRAIVIVELKDMGSKGVPYLQRLAGNAADPVVRRWAEEALREIEEGTK